MPTSPATFALFALTLPLPGLILVLGAGLHRPRHSRALAAALALLLSCAFTSAVALAAALAGVFGLGLVAAAQAATAAVAAVAWRDRLRVAWAELRLQPRLPRGPAVALLAVAGALAFLYLRPYEQFLGGQDPAVYVNTGASIARTGAIAIRDPAYAALSPAERDLFTHVRRGVRARVPGFVVRDAESGVIQPYFNHLYPVWIALFDAGLGARAGLLAGPFFALASVGLLALLGGLLFSARAGAAAALLFGFSVPAIWAARFQAAEPLALFFALGGWIGTTLFVREGRRAWAAVAAALFGCALLVKITSLLPLLLLGGASLALAAASRERARALLPAALAAALLLVAPYLLTACREYSADVLRSVLLRRGLVGPGGALLAAAGIAAACAAGLLAARLPRLARAGAAALLAGLALYGWFLRPALERSSDAANLPQLGWFLGPPALLLALAGALLLLRRPAGGREGEAQMLYLAVGAATAALLLHHKQIAPIYPWALRRYVPELLPFLALAGGAALAACAGAGPLRRPRALLAGALLAGTAGLGLARGSHLLLHRDYAGALPRIEQLAAALPAGAVTVCEDGGLATPLLYLLGREETFAAADLTPAKGELLAQTLAAWAGAGREVVFASVGGGVYSRHLGLALIGRVPFDLPLLDRTTASYPRTIHRLRADMHLFRVVPPGAPGAWRPARIDVGAASFGLRGGFHRPERLDEGGERRPYRWTAARASVDLPPPPRPGEPWELVLRIGGGRPAGAAPARVRVLVDGREVGVLAALPAAIAAHRFTVPAGVADAAGRGFVEVAIEAETFVPARTGGGGDERELGVMWESAEWCQ